MKKKAEQDQKERNALAAEQSKTTVISHAMAVGKRAIYDRSPQELGIEQLVVLDAFPDAAWSVDKPCICKATLDLDDKNFQTTKLTKVAFMAGFPKSESAKIKGPNSGRGSWDIPSSDLLAQWFLQLVPGNTPGPASASVANFPWGAFGSPACIKTARKAMSDALAPNFFGYSPRMQYEGTDVLALPSLRFQMEGTRAAIMIHIAQLMHYIVKEKKGSNINSYQEVKEFIKLSIADSEVRRIRDNANASLTSPPDTKKNNVRIQPLLTTLGLCTFAPRRHKCHVLHTALRTRARPSSLRCMLHRAHMSSGCTGPESKCG